MTEPCSLNKSAKQQLIAIARASIQAGLKQRHSLEIAFDQYDESLSQKQASFVTLRIDQELRGCIGSLEAYRPLAEDVAENAFNAAFRDPRFPPLTEQEAPHVHIHISLLSDSKPLYFTDEKDLLRKIRPGVDGLILQEGQKRGTFLPSVWEQLPTKEDFLAQLKLKAGLPANYWSQTINVEHYTVEEIDEDQFLH